MVGDVGKMIVVGLIWGTTNSLMRRGALLWDQRSSSSSSSRRGSGGALLKWLDLILIWQYSLPFLVNLSASAAFFYLLGASPISVAVPVTNAVTFAATAVSAILLGEETKLAPALLGTLLILLGISICIA